ncbi:MAG TPA: hypothetical protein VJ957_10105 [Longimicrobiales bacterium]|nr:hypothetical protein [Longimicrobiales bacterium]
MILPNVRASFGRMEAGFILGILSRANSGARRDLDDRLRDEGFDGILDDPRTLNAVLTEPRARGLTPGLFFYVLVRHALLESGVDDRTLADYIAAMLLEFASGDRAYRIDASDGDTYFYLVDIVGAMGSAKGRRAFLLQAHLGDFALWLSGLFPDAIVARTLRRGAPGLEYYEEMGSAGYRLAASARQAGDSGLDAVYRHCAAAFPDVRTALNRISDRYLFRTRGDSVNRLLRQVSDAFRARTGR